MFALFYSGSICADRAAGIVEFLDGILENSGAIIALITFSFFGATIGALTFDIAICKAHLAVLAIKMMRFFVLNPIIVSNLFEDLIGNF